MGEGAKLSLLSLLGVRLDNISEFYQICRFGINTIIILFQYFLSVLIEYNVKYPIQGSIWRGWPPKRGGGGDQNRKVTHFRRRRRRKFWKNCHYLAENADFSWFWPIFGEKWHKLAKFGKIEKWHNPRSPPLQIDPWYPY